MCQELEGTGAINFTERRNRTEKSEPNIVSVSAGLE
jgi:hypothetical protein